MATTDQVSRAMDSTYATICKEQGARLAETRKAQGITRIELAQQFGVAQQTLAHYEVGRVSPPVRLIIAMARTLNFSLDDMLTGASAGRAKRGPASRFERQIEALSRLAKSSPEVRRRYARRHPSPSATRLKSPCPAPPGRARPRRA